MKNVTLKVEGMSCNHCVNSVEGTLKTLGAQGKVNLPSGTVDVAFDDSRLTIDQIKEAIEEQGYDVV
ncbi:copper ion binding protein [Cohnella faecalis]|uniref:Copper chaperone n=1 Tax=Cohnella faecalis TaxID=2315694 RepID=A0A398CJ73_9BACL|nr:copper ion binding protein [Cohnella faecalis]RIE02162.1 copper chaperone [Cohnella faecalis]